MFDYTEIFFENIPTVGNIALDVLENLFSQDK